MIASAPLVEYRELITDLLRAAIGTSTTIEACVFVRLSQDYAEPFYHALGHELERRAPIEGAGAARVTGRGDQRFERAMIGCRRIDRGE